MKCYYDPTQDAIGVYKNCGRGLSSGHLSDLGNGLACKDRCEGRVKDTISLLDRSISTSSTSDFLIKGSSKASFIFSLFVSGLGIIFLFDSFYYGFDVLSSGAGTLFLGFGIFSFIRAKAIRRSLEKKQNEPMQWDLPVGRPLIGGVISLIYFVQQETQ
jgi:hypothetical protein